ncbi:DivIVA domain-containing protein [Arthrobacter zhaoxinii]|uniref:DivIVA domain-containing protein n=1 Tax=Arthrobacter zhaoxinii TaxID=2964616 RepID=UPI00387E53E5
MEILIGLAALLALILVIIRKSNGTKKPPITADEVAEKRFMPRKIRQGYDSEQVTELLKTVVLELRRLEKEREQLQKADILRQPVPVTSPIITPEQVVNQRFTVSQFRPGLDQDEVDDFLDLVVVDLRRWTSENEQLRTPASGEIPETPQYGTPTTPG